MIEIPNIMRKEIPTMEDLACPAQRIERDGTPTLAELEAWLKTTPLSKGNPEVGK